MTLTPLELEALPTLTVHMDGGLEVHVRPEAYMDALGKDNAYAPRCVHEVMVLMVLVSYYLIRRYQNSAVKTYSMHESKSNGTLVKK